MIRKNLFKSFLNVYCFMHQSNMIFLSPSRFASFSLSLNTRLLSFQVCKYAQDYPINFTLITTTIDEFTSLKRERKRNWKANTRQWRVNVMFVDCFVVIVYGTYNFHSFWSLFFCHGTFYHFNVYSTSCVCAFASSNIDDTCLIVNINNSEKCLQTTNPCKLLELLH